MLDSSVLPAQNGTLGVALHKATLNDEARGRAKLDLFCQVYVGSQIQKTNNDSKNDHEPIWNEYLTFKRENETQVIIEIRNHNIFFLSKLIGECIIDLAEVLAKRNICLKQEIRDGEKVIGILELALKWEIPSSVPSGPVVQQKINIENGSSLLIPSDVREFFQQGLDEPIVVLRTGLAPKFVMIQPGDTDSSTTIDLNGNGITDSSKVVEEAEEEPSNIPEGKRCIICSKRAKAGVFYRCGHNCCCNTCGRGLIGSPCPICNKHIDDFVKVYRT